MSGRWLVGLLACTLLPSPASALEDPQAGARDARLRVVAYNPDQVVDLQAEVGETMAIQFSDNETVIDVAASDRANMKIAPNGSVLFLKPVRPMPSQPVFVKTRRDAGAIRLYTFQWQAEDNTDPTIQPYYRVRFTYPADVAAARAAAWHRAKAVREAAAAKKALDDPIPPVPPNYRYVAQGDRNLVPDRVWDDAQSTYLHFSGNARMPAVYVVGPEGKEALTNYSVENGTIIIHETARQFRLRDGDTVLCLWNQGWNPVGTNPGTGTTSPDVIRTIKGAAR